ncbi:hypothetical protein V8C86DRAFT_3149705 [Haematococcus lacustris]
MGGRQSSSESLSNGVALEAASAVRASSFATSLLDLPATLLEDIASRTGQAGARAALSHTCFVLFEERLVRAPALRIQLDRQRCGQRLPPRIVAALRGRTAKLAVTFEQHQPLEGGQYAEVLAHALAKLGRCAAVGACKLISGDTQAGSGPHSSNDTCSDSGNLNNSDSHSGNASDSDSGSGGLSVMSSAIPNKRTLDCPPHLAQLLLSSFPALTAVSLHNYTIRCSGLVSLLSHPQLALQLQQLDLTGTVIPEPEEAGPGPAPAAALASLFQGLRLRQLSLAGPLLPDLQPLAQHLTQLRLEDCKLLSLLPLAQLQVLTVCRRLHGLPVLLQALPRLHTLQLPGMCICEQQLDALLAATQLTSIQLASIRELTSSRADLPCSWQRLELLQNIAYSTVTCLPLHCLTQPLVLGGLYVGVGAASDAEVAAAVQQLVTVTHLQGVSAADVTALAPACRACTHLQFMFGSMKPSLELWRQLVQLMPTVQQLAWRRLPLASCTQSF